MSEEMQTPGHKIPSDQIKPGDSAISENFDSHALAGESPGTPAQNNLENNTELGMLLGIDVNLSIEMGSKKIKLKDLLNLNKGSVVELNKTAGDPLDIKINGTLIARGEVVVINGKYGIRLTEVSSKSDRFKSA